MSAFFKCSLILVFLVRNQPALGISPSRPSRKTWWAKQVTPDMYVAARLTETQVKYASEVGFKSIIAIPTYTSASSIGEEVLPDSPRLADLAVNQCGMFYNNVMEPGDDWASMETVTKFSSIVAEAPPPYLVICNSFTSSGFNALAYLANQTRLNPSFTPKVDSAEFYKRASSMGLTFNQPKVKALVSDLTGEAVVANPPIADVALSNWPRSFWLAKPYSKYVLVSGQIRSNYLDQVDGSGFKVIINSRKGVTTQPNNEPSQEEVTLLNIKDKTGTYDVTGRQSEQRLLENRIDPNKPNVYIGAGSKVNYASRNHLEYGDDVGYNETIMRLDIEQRLPGVSYFHTPIGGQFKYNLEMWNAYKDIWVNAVKKNQPVLFACRTAYRSSVAALLTIGTIEKRDSKWALEKAKAHGYHFEEDDANDIINLFKDVLDKYNDTSNSDLLPQLSITLVIIWLSTLVLVLPIS